MKVYKHVNIVRYERRMDVMEYLGAESLESTSSSVHYTEVLNRYHVKCEEWGSSGRVLGGVPRGRLHLQNWTSSRHVSLSNLVTPFYSVNPFTAWKRNGIVICCKGAFNCIFKTNYNYYLWYKYYETKIKTICKLVIALVNAEVGSSIVHISLFTTLAEYCATLGSTYCNVKI